MVCISFNYEWTLVCPVFVRPSVCFFCFSDFVSLYSIIRPWTHTSFLNMYFCNVVSSVTRSLIDSFICPLTCPSVHRVVSSYTRYQVHQFSRRRSCSSVSFVLLYMTLSELIYQKLCSSFLPFILSFSHSFARSLIGRSPVVPSFSIECNSSL